MVTMVLFPVGFLLELSVIFNKCSVLLRALMGHLKGRLSNCISLIWIFRIDSMSNIRVGLFQVKSYGRVQRKSLSQPTFGQAEANIYQPKHHFN